MERETIKTILVIEEQVDIRTVLTQGLSAKGFSTISAESGRIGIQQAQNRQPDLITCGITLPDIDGYAVLMMLRQNPTTAITPFIFVTDKESRTDLRKAMELGANDYLTKPCTLEELVRAIDAQLEKQTIMQQWFLGRSRPRYLSTTPPNATTHLYPSVTSSHVAPTAARPPFVWPNHAHLSRVFRFIEANYHRPITLNDVAQAVGYSPAYLTNLMRRQTGQTVQRWIIERRMAAARCLLLETDQVVTQIATQVGYHHVVHFFRQFRKFHGTTPQVWRSSHRVHPTFAD